MSGNNNSISVTEALNRVLSKTKPLIPKHFNLMNSKGHICAENLRANSDFPSFPASSMDGYAVSAPLEPGNYDIIDRIHAGDKSDAILEKGQVVYITTGAKLPQGANAVVRIEDTQITPNDDTNEKKTVSIKVKIEPGNFVRQIGSDIAKGEVILNSGQIIKAAEIGLLATAGVTKLVSYLLIHLFFLYFFFYYFDLYLFHIKFLTFLHVYM